MELSFCSFASGSSGNCYLVKSRETAILIDAGISTKRIHAALDEMSISREEVGGVFVTHEHSDHIKGLKVLTKQNPEWQVFASPGTNDCIRDKVYDESNLNSVNVGMTTQIGDLEVKSINVSHDAANPVCYSIKCGDAKLMVLTDTGFVSKELESEMISADMIVLEANYEANMLKAGPYPYNLKLRILGDKGHLSNETAGESLAKVMTQDVRYRKVFLAHLSKENNFPGLALQTVKNILEENRVFTGKDLSLNVMQRDAISGITEL